MPPAFGTCPGCKGWGALWEKTTLVKRFWLFGPLVPNTIYRCDECDARGNWGKEPGLINRSKRHE